MLIFRRSRSRMFFKIGLLKHFAIFTGKHLCWPLQAFFYRTLIVTAATFSLQQIVFFFRWIWYLLLTVTPAFAPSKTQLTPQKQPLELFCKKSVIRNLANFTGKELYWSFFSIELQELCSFITKRCFPEEFTKFLRTPHLIVGNDCIWNLLFNLICTF